MTINRVKSGIAGLDKLIEGGFPKNSVTLVSGAPGTGKTTFALQYIYNGAKKGEPGIYISFEQEPEELKASVKQLGMDFDKLEKEKNAVILRIKNTRDITDILKMIKENAKKIKAKRLVVDSLSSIEIFATTYSSLIKDLPTGVIEKRFGFYPPTEAIIRRMMYQIIDYFKDLELTTLLTAESQDMDFSRYGVAEFVADGLIKMHYLGIGAGNFRSLKIVKLRETKHEEDFVPFEIDKNGIVIKESEKFKA